MAKKIEIMDGNQAAAYISYAFTEVAGIFPITPSSPMAEHVDEWAANGKKNLFGQPVPVSYTHLMGLTNVLARRTEARLVAGR